jgi:hypothetical protein
LHGSPEDEATLARIAEDYERHVQKPLVVFDFRGNPGGNDGYVNEWLEKAKQGPWTVPFATLRMDGGRQTCPDWNSAIVSQIAYDRFDTPEGKREREAIWNDLNQPLRDTPAEWLEGDEATSKSAHPYSGRIIALIDRDSASSGETAPDNLRAALGATILGERSGGYMELGNVRPWVMPRTGAIWQMATKRNFYPTPREFVGLPVDVYLDDDLLALPVEELLPLLKKLPKK